MRNDRLISGDCMVSYPAVCWSRHNYWRRAIAYYPDDVDRGTEEASQTLSIVPILPPDFQLYCGEKFREDPRENSHPRCCNNTADLLESNYPTGNNV